MFEETAKSLEEKSEWGRRLLKEGEAILNNPDEIDLIVIVVFADLSLIYFMVIVFIEYFSSNGTPPSIL